MSRYKPYPAYRDSKVEWIGDVPEHWDVVRIAQLGPLTKANGGSKQDNVDAGIPCIRYGDLYTTHEYLIRGSRSYIGADKLGDYTPVQYGDALFAASGETFEDIGRSAVNLLQEKACCGGDVIIFRPAVDLDSLFLGYALDSLPSKAQKSLMGKGYTVVHVYADQLRDLIMALPPPSEQEAIGADLNRETARIDALIAKKTRFIELLKERRSALITEAVTGKFDVATGKPYPKYKDSGIPWLGEVPEGWMVTKLKRGFAVKLGKMLQPHQNAKDQVLCPYVRASNIQPEGVDASDFNEMWMSPTEMNILRLYKGDLLVSEGGDVGRSAIWNDELPEAYFQNSINRVRALGGNNNQFLNYLLKSVKSAGAVDVICNRLSIAHLTAEKLNEIDILLPDEKKQSAIAAFLDRKTARIDAVVGKTQKSIELLKERRSALITAAVTGKIDVRNPADLNGGR